METEEIYKKIVMYYDIIDKIRAEILKLQQVDDREKFQTLIPVADDLQKEVDTLMEKYVLFSKDTTNEGMKNEILAILKNILDIVYNYKNIVYDLYNK